MKLTKLNMQGIAHYIAPLIVVVVFVVAGVGYLVASHADGDNCNDTWARPFEVCSNTSQRSNYAFAQVSSPYNYGAAGTLVEYQCASNGTNCSAISAAPVSLNGPDITSSKPYSPGHLYKACFSGHDSHNNTATNYCSAAKP